MPGTAFFVATALLLPLAAAPVRPVAGPEVRLKGEVLRLPVALHPDGKRQRLNLLISAEKETLQTTLFSRGWSARSPEAVAFAPASLRVGGRMPDLDLEASGPSIDLRYNLRLWQQAKPGGDSPLWFGVASTERGIAPLQPEPPVPEPSPQAVNRVIADLSFGVSQTRQLKALEPAGGRIAWVELHFGPEDAEHLLELVRAPEPSPLPPLALLPKLLPLPPPQPRPAEVIASLPKAGRRVALTFDACSTLDRSKYDQAVIDTLIKLKVPATLFISGRWAETHARIMHKLASEPLFELGNHSYIHPHMTEVPPDRQREELLWTQQILYAFTGKVPRFFRPPYGEWDASVTTEASRLGLVTVEYNLPSGDPDKKLTAAKITSWVLSRAKPGSVIVMHMNQHGWHTAESLPAIVKGLRAKGLVLSTVGQMVDAGESVAAAALDAWSPPAPDAGVELGADAGVAETAVPANASVVP